MGVFSAVAGNQLPNQLQKTVLPALFHLRCPSQSHQRSAPWTHTSDDSYIYQLSLVLATATVSYEYLPVTPALRPVSTWYSGAPGYDIAILNLVHTSYILLRSI